MSNSTENPTTDELLKELLASVATLHKDVNKLKSEGSRVYLQKCLRKGDGNGSNFQLRWKKIVIAILCKTQQRMARL